MNSLYKVIITYELIFLLFWNILYLSNSDIENWFTEKFLTAIFVFLSTMALGATLVYIIFISLKLTGISKILKNIKDPRKN
jgi:predicted membrane protein